MQVSKKKDTITFIEVSILAIIWLIVFLSPVIIQYSSDEIKWEQVFNNWRRLSPFLVLSLFNHFVLVPVFFFNKAIVKYVMSVLVTLLLFSFLLTVFFKPDIKTNRPEIEQEFRPPHPPPLAQPRKVDGDRRPKRLPPEHRNRPPHQPGALPPFLNSALIALLILGFDTGLRTVFKWSKSEQEKEVLENEKVKSELAFLRNQVNPHFLMNTLNNIHALVDIDSEEAKDTVIRLSKLMRYLLYDTERELIPIKEELSFIRSYVELMQMRISKMVTISLDIKVFDEDKKIPPLLFTSLIENAFKYGVSNRKETFIKIDLNTTSDELRFKLSNTIVKKAEEGDFYSGIGLHNTKKRLNILYGDSFTLDISSDSDIFSVSLKIPV